MSQNKNSKRALTPYEKSLVFPFNIKNEVLKLKIIIESMGGTISVMISRAYVLEKLNRILGGVPIMLDRSKQLLYNQLFESDQDE